LQFVKDLKGARLNGVQIE